MHFHVVLVKRAQQRHFAHLCLTLTDGSSSLAWSADVIPHQFAFNQHQSVAVVRVLRRCLYSCWFAYNIYFINLNKTPHCSQEPIPSPVWFFVCPWLELECFKVKEDDGWRPKTIIPLPLSWLSSFLAILSSMYRPLQAQQAPHSISPQAQLNIVYIQGR